MAKKTMIYGASSPLEGKVLGFGVGEWEAGKLEQIVAKGSDDAKVRLVYDIDGT